jgi:O-antigen/teichoic acid export membrane protein
VERRPRRISGRKAPTRELTVDTVWSLAYQAMILTGSLVSFYLLGRHLGPSGYGLYVALYAIVTPLGAFAYSGTMLTMMQYALRERQERTLVVRSCLSLTVSQGAVLALAGALVTHLVLPKLSVPTIALIFASELIVSPLVEFAATTTQMIGGFAASTPIRMAPIIAKVLSLAALAATHELTLESVAIVYVSTNAVLAVACLRLVVRRYQITVRPGHIHGAHLRDSMTFAVGMSSLSLQNDSDKLVLSAYHFEREGGLYAAAYRIVQLGLVPISALVDATHLRFLEHDSRQYNQHLRRSIKFASAAVLYGVVVAVGLWFAAPLPGLIVGSQFKQSATIIRFLVPLVPLRALSSFPMNGLMGLGKVRARTALLMISAAVSFTSYVILVPRYTWKGAVAGTMISESFLAICTWSALVYFQRQHNAELRSAPTAEEAIAWEIDEAAEPVSGSQADT